MKIIKTFCDKCKRELLRKEDMYVLSHEPVIQGYPIMCDYRVDEPLNFCGECFDEIYFKSLK